MITVVEDTSVRVGTKSPSGAISVTSFLRFVKGSLLEIELCFVVCFSLSESKFDIVRL